MCLYCIHTIHPLHPVPLHFVRCLIAFDCYSLLLQKEGGAKAVTRFTGVLEITEELCCFFKVWKVGAWIWPCKMYEPCSCSCWAEALKSPKHPYTGYKCTLMLPWLMLWTTVTKCLCRWRVTQTASSPALLPGGLGPFTTPVCSARAHSATDCSEVWQLYITCYCVLQYVLQSESKKFIAK